MGQSRATKWNGMRRKITSRIPPDSDELLHHIKRTNYQAWILKRYDDPAQPLSTLEHEWCRDMNGRIIPVISSNAMLPDDLRILAERNINLEDTDNYSDSSTYFDSDDEEENELF